MTQDPGRKGRRGAGGGIRGGSCGGHWRAVIVCGALVGVACGQPARRGDEPDQRRAAIPLAEIPAATAPAAGADCEMPANVRECYEVAQRLVEEEKYELAAEQLDGALRVGPAPSFEVLLLQARVKQRLKRYGEARLAAEHASVLRPGDLGVHLLLGELLREQGFLEEAAGHFRAVTLAPAREPADPRVTAAWYVLGQCLADSGYLLAGAEALAQFDRAVWKTHTEHRAADVVAPILAAHPHGGIEQTLELLKRVSRPEECAQAARQAAARRPDDPYLQRLYIQTLLEIGEAQAAFAHCRQQLDAAQDASAVPLTLVIEAAEAAGEYERWAGELRADIAQEQRIELAQRLAAAHDCRREYSRSVPLWRSLARVRPDSAEVAWALATALKETGELGAALDALSDFVRRKVEADDPPAVVEQAIAAPWLARWMRSFAHNEEFLKLANERTARKDCDFATYTVLGVTAAAAGEPELAERLFGAAVERRPDLALVHMAWGRAALATFDWARAKEQARRALEISPELAAAYLLLAEGHGGLDEFDEAEAAFKESLKQRPDDVTCMLALARHYRRIEDWLAAQRYFQQAWSADPTRADAAEELLETYLAGGKLEVARSCLEQAEAANLPDDSLRRMRTTLEFATAMYSPGHLTELRRQHEEHPDDARTALKLATGLFMRDQPGECQVILDELTPQGPEEEQAMFLQAHVHLRQLAAERAIGVLEELARRYPRRLNVLALLAEAQLRAFELADARATLERILALDPGPRQREQVRVQLLASYVDFMEYDAALRQVDAWLAETPESDVWSQRKLGILLGAERNEEALAWVHARLAAVTQEFDALMSEIRALAARQRTDPGDAEARARIRELQEQLIPRGARLFGWRDEFISACVVTERYDLATRELRKWMAEQPEQRQQFQQRLIEVLLAAGRPDDALAEIAALPALPQTAEEVVKVTGWRAQARADKGQVDEAVQELTALLSEPFVRDEAAARDAVRTLIINLLVEAGDYTLALTRCDRWLAEDEGNLLAEVEALLLKRHVLQSAGRDREYAAIGEKLLELEPRDPGLNNDVGYTWVDRGENLERATEMIRLAVANEPMNAAYLDSLGWAYYKQGDFDAARRQLARAVRMRAGQDPVVYEHLGDAEYRLGEQRAAQQHWESALALLTEDGEAGPRPALYADLELALRAKLAAVEASEPPTVAPTAAEQSAEEAP